MTEKFLYPEPAPEGLALFDLDGTLIAWDCQLLFRHFVVKREPWRGLFLPLFLVFAPLASLLGSETMKRIFLSYLWQMDRETLTVYSKEFAASLMPAIYPELREKLARHRAQGDFLILASASPEFYVKEIGRELGFHLSLGTSVEMGPLFPDLENHKGEAKVRRLKAVLPPSWFDGERLKNGHGYTDSSADLPMLRLCDAVTLVNPSRKMTSLSEQAGWEVVRPQRPWKTLAGKALRMLALLTGTGRDPGGLC